MFKALLIKSHDIKHLSWNDPNYIKNIIDLIDEIEIDNDNFIDCIEKYFDLDELNNSNINLNNIIFEDEPNYNYNMMYIDFNNNDQYKENEIGLLLNKEHNKIYSNIIILKEYLAPLSNHTSFNNMTKNNLEEILLNRINIKFTQWDTKWVEINIPLNTFNQYINNFFDDETPEKKQLKFLMHNIFILYTYSKYGNKYCYGKLLNEIPIDKCIIYTMKSEEYMSNISLDEVNKIIKLSEKLDSYNIPNEYLKDQINQYGRSYKPTKYKILDKTYNKYY
jgi:hypothetical protein